MLTLDGKMMWELAQDTLVSVRQDGFVLMQFTGLLDQNGNEIYEGDILIFRHVRHAKAFPVEWVTEKAAFTAWSPRNKVEIVGNVFENPELLGTA